VQQALFFAGNDAGVIDGENQGEYCRNGQCLGAEANADHSKRTKEVQGISAERIRA
jgi:hypothetical protein